MSLAACQAGPDSASQPVTSVVAPAVDELVEPPVISSSDGVLDLLVIAKAAVITQFTPYEPMGLVYEICTRPAGPATECPSGSTNRNEYGGTRLQLSPGDLLKVHLINKLPPKSAEFNGPDTGENFLNLNPTNLHLHGMLVSPRYATTQDATWGDNVFVYNFNSANGLPASDSNLHGTAVFDAIDYSIPIPKSHPAGLFWFHPHIHGISQDQVTAGLSGIVTVGQVSGYACTGASCDGSAPEVRHLVLKDSQILPNGTLQAQERSDFCGWSNMAGGLPVSMGQGGCDGINQYPNGGPDSSGGRWYFTINGQQYPTLTIGAPAGQLLRIVNTSAAATYDLNLWNAVEGRAMLMQVVSLDGVGIDSGSDAASLNEQATARFHGVSCTTAGLLPNLSVCTTLLHLMPSTRAEVWVTYRDVNGTVMSPPAGSAAILRTNGFNAGPMGDNWPAVDLAKVRFVAGDPAIGAVATTAKESGPIDLAGLSSQLRSANAEVPNDPSCASLAAGHKRRIFFNSVPGIGFGLGYEEVDQNDVPVAGTFVDVAPFDPAAPTVCLPLASGNLPTTERWELVNISGSEHNFHMHQVHFSVVTEAQIENTAVPSTLPGRPIMMDSLPLRHADGYCATVADWRKGACQTYPSTVDITFTVAGDFVYHCHVLSHEDAGMMAVIRVRSDGTTANNGVMTRMLLAMGLGSESPGQPFAPRIQGAMCRGSRLLSRPSFVSATATSF
jgi:L-ascorbate oxidase